MLLFGCSCLPAGLDKYSNSVGCGVKKREDEKGVLRTHPPISPAYLFIIYQQFSLKKIIIHVPNISLIKVFTASIIKLWDLALPLADSHPNSKAILLIQWPSARVGPLCCFWPSSSASSSPSSSPSPPPPMFSFRPAG
jgi:hypothetical protein